MQPAHPTTEAIWTVSALNFEVKQMLNQGMGTLWIEGEISNFACPASGHWYFTLKDEKAQCRAAMFRGRNRMVAVQPQNGQKVLVRAQVTLYEARGEFQLVVEHLEDAGVGELSGDSQPHGAGADYRGGIDLVHVQNVVSQPLSARRARKHRRRARASQDPRSIEAGRQVSEP